MRADRVGVEVDLAVLGDVAETARDVAAAVRGGPGRRSDELRARIAAEGRWALLPLPDAAGFCFTQSFQSSGLGLATAMGAALARPDRVPVAALGDGGFLMGIAELETAVRLGMGLLVMVYDDAGYGAEFHHFPDDDHGTVRFPDTDLAAIAAGFGCAAATVRAPADLAVVREWLAGPRDRPLVLDAKVRADEPSWWLAEAFKGH